MKKISILLFVIIASASPKLYAQLTTLSIAKILVQYKISERDSANGEIGKKICQFSGRPSFDCTSVTSLGEGFCLSGGRPSFDCNSLTSIGEGICLSGGRPSFDCNSLTSIGEGICLSGGRPSFDCNLLTGLGEGICLSTGRPSFDCNSLTSLGEGFCLAKGHPSYKCSGITVSVAIELPIVDVDWKWDRFRDQYGNMVWRCRGKSTGKFADDSKCFGELKNDDTWPD
jgi:hypothetical protein